MSRRVFGNSVVPLALLVAISLACSGCGGGSGGAGGVGGDGRLIGLSFAGFPTQPSGMGPGPNPQVPLPEVFIDQTLEFRFDGPIDTAILGGFALDGQGNPIELLGVAPTTATGGVPYFPYANQPLAQNSIQFRINAAPPLNVSLPSYIVGRHRDKLDTIVVDPRVPANNPLGLVFSPGFAQNSEYTFRIPAQNGILINGNPVQALGIDPLLMPLILNPFAPVPPLAPVFRVGVATGPDPVPPEVVSIEAIPPGTSTPAQNPIPADSTIRVTFTKPIDDMSVNQLSNFLVRNTDIVTPSEPEGRLVPGVFDIDPQQAQVITFIPDPSFGPGLSATQGYSIEVRVGSFGNPTIPPLLGFPQGNAQVALPLANSMARTFQTAPCPTCVGSVAVIESFDDNDKEDTGFTVAFERCDWAEPGAPGQMGGTEISGTPLASFNGNPAALGSRFQVTMPIGPNTTLPFTTVPFPGLFSPFDSMANNIMTNPNGGSHTMWMVEAVDLGTPRGSVELVEFCPVNMVVLASLYPNYQSWMGQANFAAPITCPMGGPGGMSTIYRANYTGPTFQPIDPMNTNPGMPTEGGVLVTPTFNWNMTNGLTSYFPFPVFTPPFDYLSTGQATGLIWEVNIEPGNQVSNFVKYRSTNFTPVRRLIGVPISLGSLTSTAGGCETYATRYTFVNIVSQTRSEFYDTGVPMNPRYGGVSITPRPSNQPSGTSSIWEFEGATGITGPTTPSGVTTGFLTYYSGAPAGDPVPGIEDNLIFFDPNSPTAPQLTGNRYFRFRATLRSDNLTNRRQSYNSVVMSVNVGM